MKKILFLTGLLLCLQSAVFAQIIDKPVATLKLSKTEAITLKQFKKTIQAFEQQSAKPLTLDDRKKVLDALIDEKLLLQAAGQEGISVSDAEIKQGIQKVKLSIEMQMKRQITDDQFKQVVESQGVAFSRLEEQVANQVIAEKFVSGKQARYLKDVKKPGDAEVSAYYEENRTEFVSPEMIRIKQIMILTKGIGDELAQKYKQKIDTVYKDVVSKGKSFDDYWEIYVDGTPEKVGGFNIDVWRRDDSNKKVTYGKDFFDTVFKLKPGDLSPVLKSEVGYHIIQVVEKIPFKTLQLNDKIPPQNTVTVKDQIQAVLAQKQQIELSKKALDEILKDIKKRAVIKIFDKNLEW